MSAAEKALAALEAAGKAAVPKPGKWRWSARPGSHTIDFGTHGWEAMTFARWGMNGAQPVFLTKCDGTHLLEPASKFLVPVPGEEHHKWAKRVVHPVAQLIENAVNLSAPLAAVARAAMNYVKNRTNYDALESALDALEAAAEGVA